MLAAITDEKKPPVKVVFVLVRPSGIEPETKASEALMISVSPRPQTFMVARSQPQTDPATTPQKELLSLDLRQKGFMA